MKARSYIVIVTAIASYYLLSRLTIVIPASFSALFLVLVILISCIKYIESLKLIVKQVIALIYISTVHYFVTFDMNLGLTLGFLTQSIFVIAPVYLLKMTVKSCSNKTIKIIVIIIGLIMSYVICISFIEYANNPLISRILAAGGNSTYELDNLNLYRLKNIAGFGFCYSTVFLLLLIRPLKSNGNRVLSLILELIILIFLTFAQYTTAIVLGLMCLLYSFFFQKGKKTRTVILLLTLPALYLIGDLLLSAVIKLIPGESVSYKFNDIKNFLYAGGIASTTSIQGRYELYLLSISSFLKSPIWGNSIYQIKIGDHSTVFDMMAKTGIIGITALILMVSSQFKFMVSTTSINGIKESKMLKYVLLIVLVLNPTYQHIELFFISFYLVPLVLYVIDQRAKCGDYLCK